MVNREYLKHIYATQYDKKMFASQSLVLRSVRWEII